MGLIIALGKAGATAEYFKNLSGLDETSSVFPVSRSKLVHSMPAAPTRDCCCEWSMTNDFMQLTVAGVETVTSNPECADSLAQKPQQKGIVILECLDHDHVPRGLLNDRLQVIFKGDIFDDLADCPAVRPRPVICHHLPEWV
jgi:hypothetical protein